MTDVTASPAGPPPAQAMLSKPTRTSEWTLIGVLLVVCFFAMVPIFALAWGHWVNTESAMKDRIHYLGWIAMLAVLAIMILIIAFATPWLGTVKASGMGANLEIDGAGGGAGQ